MIYLDSSSIAEFLTCRESFRLKYLAKLPQSEGATAAPPLDNSPYGTGIVGKYIAIHREAGIAIHRGVEAFWRGDSFESALDISLLYMQSIPLSNVASGDMDKWKTLQNSVPDMLAAYYDTQEGNIENVKFIEHQFKQYVGDSTCIIGRIDRVMDCGGIQLIDTKTATQIGSERQWKRDYKESALRDFQLPLYDWYLCGIGLEPREIKLEVLIKPNERYGTKAKLVEIDMREIIAYRDRTKSQIENIVSEVGKAIVDGAGKYPWLMASSNICMGKFGPCPYLDLCNYGLNERQLKNFIPRREHLIGITERVTAE